MRRSREGDPEALGELAPLVYEHLHRIAEGCLRAERPDHTLSATALLHEAWIKLLGNEQPDVNDRNHFFAMAARRMRQILVDYARSRSAAKRGAGKRGTLDEAMSAAADSSDPESLLMVNELLDRLETSNPRRARFFELRFFGGLKPEEIAALDGVSPQTIYRELRLTQAWLYQELEKR